MRSLNLHYNLHPWSVQTNKYAAWWQASAWPFSQSLPFPFSHPVHDQGVIHIMSVGPFTETLREFTQPLDQIKEADVIHKLGVDKSDGRVDR